MTGEPQVTVVGNLTADPELRYTAQSVAVASFTVASTPRNYNRNSGQWEEGTALFMRCSAWRDMAENISESLSKGMRVIVTGRLIQNNWERDGRTRSSIEIQVDEVGPSLRYAQAQVSKISRGSDSNFSNRNNQGGFQQQGGGSFGGYNQNGVGNQSSGGFGGPQNGSSEDPWATGSTGSDFDNETPPF